MRSWIKLINSEKNSNNLNSSNIKEQKQKYYGINKIISEVITQLHNPTPVQKQDH